MSCSIPKFGMGTVERAERDLVTVLFPSVGYKTLLASAVHHARGENRLTLARLSGGVLRGAAQLAERRASRRGEAALDAGVARALGAAPLTRPRRLCAIAAGVACAAGSARGHASHAAPTPTPPPITVDPPSAPRARRQRGAHRRRLGDRADLRPSCTTARSSTVAIDQSRTAVTIVGKTPGTTVVTVSDARGFTRDVPVRVAYYAGTIADRRSTLVDHRRSRLGRSSCARKSRAAVVRAAASAPGRAGRRHGRRRSVLAARSTRTTSPSFDVPVLIQRQRYFEVDGSTHVDVQNVAVPRISPDSLMVSDYPERLDGERHALHRRSAPRSSRRAFCTFTTTRPDSRPRASCCAQIISRASPRSCSSSAGAAARRRTRWRSAIPRRKRFLVNVVQNQGRLLTTPRQQLDRTSSSKICRLGTIVCNLLQLRVLSGGNVHLTLFAQNAADESRRCGQRFRATRRRRTSTRAASIRSPSFTSRRSGRSTTIISSFRSASSRCPTICAVKRCRETTAYCNRSSSTSQNPTGDAASDRDLRKSARRPLDRNLPDRRRAGAVASGSAAFALQSSPVCRAGARIRARHDRDDARSRLEPIRCV